jgi:FdhD protein
MTNSVDKSREIIRFNNGNIVRLQDKIVTEYPVTIKINGEEFATMVSSPEYIEDLAIGFLASEGVIQSYEDITDIWFEEKAGFVHMKVNNKNEFFQRFHSKRYITSCCGKSRQGFYFMNDAKTAKVMKETHVTLTFEDCFRLMSLMQDSANTFRDTGGVHNAALCNKDGIVISRQDIGRHNALDKIYGFCLKNNMPLSDKIIVFSGRISSEILLKVAKIGCEIVLSKSAPTELALQLADELGITTVGFIRNHSLNVYTHASRLQGMKEWMEI